MKIALILFSIFMLVGCSVVTPPVVDYKITTKELIQKSESSQCSDKTLKVSQAFSLSYLMTSEMSYIEDGLKIYQYSQAQWIESPTQVVSYQVLSAMNNSSLFGAVLSSKSRASSDMILEINIEDFMQYYYDNLTSSDAKVKITLTLIDTKTSKIIATKTFSSLKNIRSLDASGGVVGLGLALDDILEKSIKFFSEVCR